MKLFRLGLGGRFGKGEGKKMNLKIHKLNVATLSEDESLAKTKKKVDEDDTAQTGTMWAGTSTIKHKT